MKVKGKILDSVQKEKIEKSGKNNQDPLLEMNQEYYVYGMEFKEGAIYYAIFSYDESCYPDFINSMYFEVIDPRMSKYFRIKNLSNKTIINSKEWIDDENFYEKILDDYSEEISKYFEYKLLIETEFLNLRMELKEKKNNDTAIFSNKFGIIAGVVHYSGVEKNKWYDVDVVFIKPLEFNVNYFINYDYEIFSNIEADRLIMNLKIYEIFDEISEDAYTTILVCNFNNCKIKIPIVLYHEEIKIGDYLKIKCNIQQIRINILDD